MVEHEKTSILDNASPRARWIAAGLALLAFLLLLDSTALIYAGEEVPKTVEPPTRFLFERDALIAGFLPSIVRYAIFALGAIGLFCWIDRLSIGLSRITMLVIAVMVAIMFYEVFVRYVLNQPTLWVNEMSLWLAGGVYLLAGLYVMQQRAHIRIFILYDLVPRWLQRVFDLISTSLIVLFAAMVVYGGFNESWKKLLRWETFGTAWDPPIPATIKPLILITVVLIAMQAISNLICDWGKGKETHNLAEEVAEEMGDLVEGQRAI